MPENFTVLYLKFKQETQTLVYIVKKMQMEQQRVKTLIRLSPRNSLIWVCTICPDQSVLKLRIITEEEIRSVFDDNQGIILLISIKTYVVGAH